MIIRLFILTGVFAVGQLHANSLSTSFTTFEHPRFSHSLEGLDISPLTTTSFNVGSDFIQKNSVTFDNGISSNEHLRFESVGEDFTHQSDKPDFSPSNIRMEFDRPDFGHLNVNVR